VDIGGVPEYETTSGSDLSLEPAMGIGYPTPFAIEKYISVDGERYNMDDGVSAVRTGDLTRNISDVFPGSMRMVTDAQGNDVGITGTLGVRYGLRFLVGIEGTAYEVCAVEVDALDLPLLDFKTLPDDSKLLLCLLNLLKKDKRYGLLTKYILPLNKLTSIAAIYTDMAFLPSIGETTVTTGQTYLRGSFLSADTDEYKDGIYKPGLVATVETGDDPDDDTIVRVTGVDVGPNEGVEGAWSSKKDRNVVSLFWLEFDDWDQVILRNSKYRIKKLFRTYYNSRDFDPDDISKALDGGPGQFFIKNLLEALKPAPGKRLLPWWRKRRLRSNPFNANGELCEKDD
jgi:hypothetical protein